MSRARQQRAATALILGTNEIASAAALALHADGYACLLSHDPFPPVIRRGMAFHDSLFGETIVLAGVAGRRVETGAEIARALDSAREIGVTPLSLSELIPLRMPDVLVDARMQKYQVTPDWRRIARVTVGLGPNFAVGRNCDIAVETRPSDVARIVERGETEAGDRTPRPLGGVGAERFVYADRDGPWHTALDIGARVYRGVVIGRLGGAVIASPIDGVLRGIARDGSTAFAGAKLIEIDPRGREACWTGVDERGAQIARAVVEAVRLKQAELNVRLEERGAAAI
ncbi:xanthine dehydrogenase [Methylocystis parvus]|uniref:xanthine dehydrogenase n=1 Tax=Methylocystis parvus TaxID=134 RepID=UPI003C78BB19